MLLRRAYVFRLEPTVEQEMVLAQTAGACRVIYNLALEQRNLYWRPGCKITLKTQSHELTELRRQVDWLRAAPVHALHSELENLDRAMKRFMAGHAKFPRFKRKGVRDGFHLKGRAYLGFRRLNRNMGAVRLAKIGWVKLRGFRPLGGELRNVTVSRRSGRWFVSIAWQAEMPDPAPSMRPAAGLDRGVAVIAALSTGQQYAAPAFFARIEKRLANAQRTLARRVKGSANWRKQKGKVACLHSKAANARRDFLHKTSTEIAKNHGMVAIEKLQVKNMTRSAQGANVAAKTGLNRAILDKGWGTLVRRLRYKLEERGGDLIEVPAAYTSRTCSECGAISKDNRKSQAEFACIGCGHTANADTNAAINILRAGHARWACESNHISGRKQELLKEATHVAI